MINSAKVHSFDLASQFLEFLLKNDAPTTTLVICSARDAFLEQLANSTNHAQQAEGVPEHEAAPGSPTFLNNSIGLIAKSQRVKLAFCPSLEVLRAYLSTIQASTTRSQSTGRPLLAILNLVAIHYGTPELSAQGLSRTFAATTEVASRENMNLALCECKGIMAGEHDTEPGGGRWSVQVPLLSTSVGLGEGEGTSTGQTVTVKRVAQKWFDFEKIDNTTEAMEI